MIVGACAVLLVVCSFESLISSKTKTVTRARLKMGMAMGRWGANSSVVRMEEICSINRKGERTNTGGPVNALIVYKDLFCTLLILC